MKKIYTCIAIAILGIGVIGGTWWFMARNQNVSDVAQKPLPLRIMWFAQYSADVVQELSKDFTAKTGIPVIVDQVSVPDYAKIAYREMESGYPRFDLLVGDSQWLGYGATSGYYEDLAHFVDEHKMLGTFHEQITKGYGEYPEDSGKYYAVPFGANAITYAYRVDWFEDPAERAAFAKRYGRALEVPRTYAELRDVAEFFYRPEEGRYGIVFPTGEAYDAITMLFGSMLFGYGGSWGDRAACVADGHINNDGAVEAFELYKELYGFSPKDAAGSLYQGAWERYYKGDVAMEMNFISHARNVVNPAINPYASSTGFFGGLFGPKSRDSQLAGQGVSIMTGARNPEGAHKFLDWWIEYDTQNAFAKAGGFSTFRRVTASEEFKKNTVYNIAYADSIAYVRDFWNSPRYADLLAISQKNIYAAIVGTSTKSTKETLDTIAEEWRPILATECK